MGNLKVKKGFCGFKNAFLTILVGKRLKEKLINA